MPVNKKPEAWDALDKLRGPALPKTAPPGAFTKQQYMDHYQASESAARRQISKMLSAGVLLRVGRTAGSNVQWYVPA
jgi:hypothetical protein